MSPVPLLHPAQGCSGKTHFSISICPLMIGAPAARWLSHTQSDLTKATCPLTCIKVGVLWMANMQPSYPPPPGVHSSLFVCLFDSLMPFSFNFAIHKFLEVFIPLWGTLIQRPCSQKLFCIDQQFCIFFYLMHSLKLDLVLYTILPPCYTYDWHLKRTTYRNFQTSQSREKSIMNIHVFIHYSTSTFCQFLLPNKHLINLKWNNSIKWIQSQNWEF